MWGLFEQPVIEEPVDELIPDMGKMAIEEVTKTESDLLINEVK